MEFQNLPTGRCFWCHLRVRFFAEKFRLNEGLVVLGRDGGLAERNALRGWIG